MGVTKVVTKPIGCLLKILITLVIIVALIVAAVAVVVNLTPRKLGLHDVQLGDQTIEEMGFADVKIKDIYTTLKSLAKPDESKIVTNKPTEEDTTAAESNTEGSSIASNEENGKPDYSAVLSGEVTYDKEYYLTYNDTTLAYIFSHIVADANNQAEGTSDENIKYLADLGANFDEITIKDKNAENGSATLRLVASISLASIKSQIEGVIPEALRRFVPVPDKVYIVSYITIDTDETGVLTYTSQSVKINDTDSVLTDAIFKVLASMADAGSGDTKALVNEKIGAGFSYFVSNLGKIGTATVKSGTNEVDVKTLGDGGIQNGKLTLITNVAA